MCWCVFFRLLRGVIADLVFPRGGAYYDKRQQSRALRGLACCNLSNPVIPGSPLLGGKFFGIFPQSGVELLVVNEPDCFSLELRIQRGSFFMRGEIANEIFLLNWKAAPWETNLARRDCYVIQLGYGNRWVFSFFLWKLLSDFRSPTLVCSLNRS